VTDKQRTPSRRPRAAILLPTPDHRAYKTAVELARRVAASGWEIVAIEPRAAESAALRDAGRDRGVHRFVLDVPVTGDAPPPLFGSTPAERLVADLLIERDIHLLHAHLAGELVVLPLLECAWLLGIPLVATVHDGWSPSAGLEPERGVLAERLVRDLLGLADLVCAPDARGLDAASTWADEPRVIDHAGSKGGRGWADLYQLMAGDLTPPRTPLTLSVIVTTYQRHAVLRDCLEALADQTLPRDKFEVIVVDDGSQPSAGPVVEAFGDRLDVTFVRLDTNVGLGAARNAGIEASRGDVLFFLDDDDEPAPRCLAEHLRSHSEYGDEVEAVVGWTGPTVDQVTSLDGWLAFRGRVYINHSMRHLEVLDWSMFWGGRTSIRREALGDERFELPFLEDADLAYRLSRRKLRVTHNRHAVQRIRIGLDAAALLRRASRVGQARANLAQHHPELSDRSTFSSSGYLTVLAAALPHRNGARLRTLTVGALAGPGVTLEALRAQPDPDTEGSRLQGIAADLRAVSNIETALGWMLGERRIAAREAGRPLRIGVGASSPLLPELVSGLRSAPPGSAVLVVGAPPGMPRPQLDAVLAGIRAEDGSLAVEPLACRSATDLWVACDVMVAMTPPEGHDPARHAVPLTRGPLAESLQRILHTRDLVGSFR
jgi:hypothetical protein